MKVRREIWVLRHVLRDSLSLTILKRRVPSSESHSMPGSSERPRCDLERELSPAPRPSEPAPARSSLRGRARELGGLPDGVPPHPGQPRAAGAPGLGAGRPPCVPRPPHLRAARGRRPHLARGLPRPLRRHDPRLGGGPAPEASSRPSAGRTSAERSPTPLSTFRADARKCVTETRPASPASGGKCTRRRPGRLYL